MIMMMIGMYDDNEKMIIINYEIMKIYLWIDAVIAG